MWHHETGSASNPRRIIIRVRIPLENGLSDFILIKRLAHLQVTNSEGSFYSGKVIEFIMTQIDTQRFSVTTNDHAFLSLSDRSEESFS